MTLPAPASFPVHIEPGGWRIDASPGVSLLASARSQGVVLPSSCRNGTCRACMCSLREGRVSYLIEWPGLSAEEKQQGFILPCVAVAETPLTLDAPHATRAVPPPL
jgi:ferredoxin